MSCEGAQLKKFPKHEITTYYVRLDEQDRRRTMKADYGFVCKCLLCTAETSRPREAHGYVAAAREKLEAVSEQVVKYDTDCMPDLNIARHGQISEFAQSWLLLSLGGPHSPTMTVWSRNF